MLEGAPRTGPFRDQHGPGHLMIALYRVKCGELPWEGLDPSVQTRGHHCICEGVSLLPLLSLLGEVPLCPGGGLPLRSGALQAGEPPPLFTFSPGLTLVTN